MALPDIDNQAPKPLLEALANHGANARVDFCIIGAYARDLWIDQSPGRLSQPLRATRDLDIAVMVKSQKEYEAYIDLLETDPRFVPSAGDPYGWFFESQIPVHIIPVGTINIFKENETEYWAYGAFPENEFTTVFEDGSEMLDLDGLPFRACTLPALVLLKCIAYENSDGTRIKDVDDIHFLLHKYLDIFHGKEFEESNLDLLDEDLNYFQLSARTLGRDGGKILRQNTPFRNRIVRFLKKELEVGIKSHFIQRMASVGNSDITSQLIILDQFRHGILDVA